MDGTTESLAVGAIMIGLFGGLALFLTGMEHISQGLKAAAGEGIRSLLANLTRNRFLAAATGAFVTAVVQSSSVTTVLVVGFVSAGIMSLAQSVGVIMGANIGSTVTAQLVAFDVSEYALLLVAAGFAMNFFGKQKEKLGRYGAMVMGLGLIFFGMSLMSDATGPLRTYEPFIELMQGMSNPVLGILVGAAFTALVQSSAATTGIVIVLATQGFITLEAGIALAFGANIGTCVTALLSTLGKPRVALQAATVHVLFNVLGVAIWVYFIDDLAEWVRVLSPSAEGLEGKARMAAETPRQIANAHTLFNVANTALFIWFTGPLAAVVRMLVPERPEVVPERAQPVYLDEVYFETPAIALDRVRLELVRLAEGVQEMLELSPAAVRGADRSALDDLVARNEDSTRLYESIIVYLSRLSRLELGSARTSQLAHLTTIANTIDNMGDTIATNVVGLGLERIETGVEPSAETVEAFAPLRNAVQLAFRTAVEAGRDRDPRLALKVVEMKGEIQSLATTINEHLARRIAAAGPERMTAYRIETSAVELLQRLYYFSKRIAKSVLEAQRSEHDAIPRAESAA